MPEPLRYLRKISIENFRGIGGTFELTIPFQHGVVLLSGMNGLGKTTFFESIEWALTGRIQRLERLSETTEIDKLELIHRYNHADSCKVALNFSKAHTELPIVNNELSEDVDDVRLVERQYNRRDTSGLMSGTSSADVIDLLRADATWEVGSENLHTYLFLTHFHPQASQLRLIARKPDERWSSFTHLAGAERLDRTRKNLFRVKHALTDMIKGREQAVSQAKSRVDAWQEALTRQDRLSNQVVAGTAVSPDGVMQNLRELAIPVASVEAAQALRQAHELNRQRLEDIHAEGERLRQGRELVAKWMSATSQLARLEGAQTHLAKELEDHNERSGALREQESIARQLLASKQHGENFANSRMQTFARVKEARAELERLRGLYPTLIADVERCEADATHAAAVLARLTEEAEARTRIQRRIAELEGGQRQLAEALLQYGRLRLAREQQVERRAQVESLRARLANIDDTGRRTRKEEEELEVIVKKCEEAVETARNRAKELENALSVIASCIGEQDQRCPVCRVEHPGGKLKELAVASARSLNPDLSALDQRLASEKQRLAAVGAALQRLRAERREVNASLNSAGSTLAVLDAEVQRLSETLREDGNDTAFVETAKARQEDAARQLDFLNSQLRSLKTTEQLASEIPLATTARLEADRVVRNVRARLEAHQTARGEAEVRAARLADLGLEPDIPTDEIATLFQDIVRSAEITKDARMLAESEVYRLATEIEKLRRGIEQRMQEQTSVREAIEVTRVEIDAMERKWRQLGLSGAPSISHVEMRDTEVTLTRDREMAIQRRLEELATGLQMWLSFQELRDLEQRLKVEAGHADLAAHTALLSQQFETAQQSWQEAIKARRLSDELGEILREDAIAFNTDVLDPLQNLFISFLQVLVHDERLRWIRFKSKPQTRGGKLHVRITPNEDEDDAVDAEMILSEGQVAEISIAALLAASVAYRWSSWRALLLDDPTQYNDLIRSTAIFEVIRNLVYFDRYQVFMSTHDMQQAEFFRRKLEGMKIPCIECRFFAQRNGLISYQVIDGTSAV